jgi:beta-glucosidase
MSQLTIWSVSALAITGLLWGCAMRNDSQPAADAPPIHPEKWPQVASPAGLDPAIEEAVTELLAKMTVEDKVGQIIQAEINNVTPEEVRKYRLGSVLNGGGGWPHREKYSTPEDWLALADAFWEASMDISEGGQAIPIIWGLDAVHGHNNVIGATIFPHNIGLGAANNPDLVRQIGRITALEMAVTGQDWNFGPTVAVARDDRWGRAPESYSEDPEIVAACGAALVEGQQGAVGAGDFLGDGRMIATAKHFIGDGGTDGGVDQGDSTASEEELRDIHGAGYVSALEAGVQTVMASFSGWHGVKMHGNRELLTDVLKGRMGFDGFIVGDWNAHGQVPGCSNKSCPDAINAGLDMFMVPKDWKALHKNTLKQAKAGEIPMERLDDAVRRILRVKMRAGLFERGKPSSRVFGGRTEILGSAEHRDVARQAVRESLVLLKNNGGLLPLSPAAHVLVAGDGANSIEKQTGGWTITWQGTGNENSDFPGASSIWDGIRRTVEAGGGTAVLSEDGDFDDSDFDDGPDVAIVVFGEDPYAEMQGDRSTVHYSPWDDGDLELLRTLASRDIPVVSVFLAGRPLWINREINASDAFVVAWLPGSEGDGVAEVLFTKADGSVNQDFRGKLSFSWPQSADQAVLNRGDADYNPLFAYGYGLTYSDGEEVGELSEDPGEVIALSRTVYFDGGPLPPWKLFIGDEADWQVPATTPVTTTRDSRHLVVTAVDRNLQEDARSARWSGEAMAAVYLAARQPVDLSRETNAIMALSFDVRVDEAPSSPVVLRMHCGSGDCFGAIDITERLQAIPIGEWGTIAVSLSRFEEAGADMTEITMPFGLATEGILALTFSNVQLVCGPVTEVVCPPGEGD